VHRRRLEADADPRVQGGHFGEAARRCRVHHALECATSLTCVESRCAQPLPIGAQCRGGDQLAFATHPACEVGFCDGGKCTVPVKLGGACFSDAACVKGLRCARHRCTDKPVAVEVGTACDPDQALCDGGAFYCDRKTRKCAAPKAAGAPCEESYECLGECAFGDKVCISHCGSG
jgi:hypothetical protein